MPLKDEPLVISPQGATLKTLRHWLLILFLAALVGTPCFAQGRDDAGNTSAPAAKEATPGIQDNSFLMEEAYNQENGVVQHINTFQRMWSSGDWVYTETDEWPVWTAKHQLSVMTVVNHAGDYPGSGAGLGDTAFNYRYQLIGNGESKIAVSPRLTMLFASGNPVQGRGFGGNGVQISLPMSVVHGKRFVSHWNVGTTIIPHQKNDAGQKASAYDVNLGNSVVWLINPRFNAFVETLWGSTEDVVAPGKTVRSQSLYINPAIRWAYNFKSGLQIVPGLGMPIGVGPSAGDKGVFLYLSFEHPFKWVKGKEK